MSSARYLANVRRFCALPGADRALLVAAWWHLLVAAVGLRWSPDRTLAAALAPSPPNHAKPAEGEAAGRIAAAVARAAAHHLGAMTCLPRSIALRRMLAARGIAARLRFGVRRQSEGIAAHAWVEVAGQPLGEPETVEERFRPLLPTDSTPR